MMDDKRSDIDAEEIYRILEDVRMMLRIGSPAWVLVDKVMRMMEESWDDRLI